MKKLTISLILAPILAISFLLYKVYEKPYSVIDEVAMQEISEEIDATVSGRTFFDPRDFSRTLMEKLIADEIWKPTMIGPMWNGDIFKKEYTLLIDSNGGSVDVLFALLDSLAEMQTRGISFKCYVSKARSAAFTFAVSVCSKTILLRGGAMGQHHAYKPGIGIDNDAYLISLKMARKEAASLLMDVKEWMAISRLGNDDKEFTVEELKKYNIIQKVYGE